MECPECKSKNINKNGQKKGKQNYICVDCRRQFIDNYEPQRGYSKEVKRECLLMYVNGMGFRAIERVKGIHNTTIMDWVKQVGEILPDYYEPEIVPEVGELDELETFVRAKKAGASLGGSLPMKGAHKTQDLDLDSRKSLPARNLRVGSRRSQCSNI